ncbi:hypothetical protein LCGC14_1791710 [marine sediment metagenome]|uniref:Uncharacterized protein n=1 Tax=marine sediment metagenome TaxID=412755 RepID=A0A0F9J755_9ZZZZ
MPLWALVTRVSSNLLIDGIIYDVIMMISFTVGLVILGASSGFTILQYVGLGLAICGLILMKVQF